MGLRGARKGILRAMRELGDVKSREEGVLNAEVERREEVLAAMERVEEKSVGLEREIRRIEEGFTGVVDDGDVSGSKLGGGGVKKLEEMRDEERQLDSEIREIENRLWELKARRGALRREVETFENRIQSQLSSYKEALGILERDVRAKFLVKKPTGLGPLRSYGVREKGHVAKDGVWDLPKERRTLVMVKDDIESEREGFFLERKAVEREQAALHEGAKVWESVVRIVSGVEGLLKEEVHKITRTPPPSDGLAVSSTFFNDDNMLVESETNSHNNTTMPTTSPSNPAHPKTGMLTILNHMDSAITEIEGTLSLAESKDWNLLVCCIGAELEALREGREMLQAALAESESEIQPPSMSVMGGTGDDHDDDDGVDVLSNTGNSSSRKSRKSSTTTTTGTRMGTKRQTYSHIEDRDRDGDKEEGAGGVIIGTGMGTGTGIEDKKRDRDQNTNRDGDGDGDLESLLGRGRGGAGIDGSPTGILEQGAEGESKHQHQHQHQHHHHYQHGPQPQPQPQAQHHHHQQQDQDQEGQELIDIAIPPADLFNSESTHNRGHSHSHNDSYTHNRHKEEEPYHDDDDEDHDDEEPGPEFLVSHREEED